ncbi:TetR/AcrR family transcriptional regulator [Bacillus sp. OAE603]|uniref:TetR/AcrR family transcriptional regulator n=1 Tax=Gottfriedia sp. OAE603 TaxID=2663872 RepID=UPI00178A9DD8
MEQKESSRTKILKTASRLFQLQGYHATGLNQITQESGAPKGSLYYHFPNGKEQLAIEAVELTSTFILNYINEGLQSSPDALRAIENFILWMAEQFEKGPMTGLPIATVALETSLVSETIRETCQHSYQKFETAFSQKLMISGFDQERAEELGVILNFMIEGACLISFTNGNGEPLRMLAKQIPLLLK